MFLFFYNQCLFWDGAEPTLDKKIKKKKLNSFQALNVCLTRNCIHCQMKVAAVQILIIKFCLR